MKLSEKQLLKFNKIDTLNPIRCHRCESIMIYEKFYGPQEHFWGWRCIWCGDIVDSLILENRGSVATGHIALGKGMG
jgi:hypothetical protein